VEATTPVPGWRGNEAGRSSRDRKISIDRWARNEIPDIHHRTSRFPFTNNQRNGNFG